MSDLKQAKMLLSMADKDLKALDGMMDPFQFDEEIFGFHTQQVIEKGLKAWIALLGLEYPHTHDIAELLGVLSRNGAEVEPFGVLVVYSAYAVRFRYESIDPSEEPLDRAVCIEEARSLVTHVKELAGERETQG